MTPYAGYGPGFGFAFEVWCKLPLNELVWLCFGIILKLVWKTYLYHMIPLVQLKGSFSRVLELISRACCASSCKVHVRVRPRFGDGASAESLPLAMTVAPDPGAGGCGDKWQGSVTAMTFEIHLSYPSILPVLLPSVPMLTSLVD